MWSSSAQGYTVISSNTREVAEAPHEITQNMKSYSHPPPLPPPPQLPPLNSKWNDEIVCGRIEILTTLTDYLLKNALSTD